jgi:hypothetical protein
MIQRIASGLIAGILVLPAFALNMDEYQLVDLSHPYNSNTLYWPTSPSDFKLVAAIR